MAEMTKKEKSIQFALGTLSPMKLFLEMLKTQNPDTIGDGDWPDNRTPKITTHHKDIHVELDDEIVFIFNAKEEFVGVVCYKW